MNWLVIAFAVFGAISVAVTFYIGAWIAVGEIKSWWFKRQFEREKARRRL